MKKFPILHYILIALLVLNLTLVPAMATETAQQTDAVETEIVNTDPLSGSEGVLLPTETFSSGSLGGDASVSSGCHSINALNPLIDTNDMLIEVSFTPAAMCAWTVARSA